jgi:hypothetical protein
MNMAEIGVAQKTGITPKIEIGTAQKQTEPYSIEGLLRHERVREVLNSVPKDIPDKELADIFNSVAEKPVASSVAVNVSAIKAEKTNTAVAKTDASISEITPTPQKPKTKEELKADRREAERLANLDEKKKREQWNQRHAPLGYFKK